MSNEHLANASPVVDVVAGVGTFTVDWSLGPAIRVTLKGNITLAMKNQRGGQRYVLILKQDATGSRTVTWPSIAKFTAGAPVMSAPANVSDAMDLFFDGGSWYLLGASQGFS